MTLFECKIRYEKTMENGVVKKVKEPYLFDAMSFSEAESRAIEELQPYMSGEFEVTDIKRVPYTEVFSTSKGDADKWYAIRINLIILDERTGIEKKTKYDYLVQASDINNARDNFIEAMKQTLADYEIVSIKETSIMDVFFYNLNKNNNE